jgi:hypothetical protein
MLRGGVVHVVSACSACGVRSQALESLVRTTVTRNSHRKSANSYQMTLYQKLCEGYKRSHHSERAIELAQHHLSLAKQNNNQVAQVRVYSAELRATYFRRSLTIQTRGGRSSRGGTFRTR